MTLSSLILSESGRTSYASRWCRWECVGGVAGLVMRSIFYGVLILLLGIVGCRPENQPRGGAPATPDVLLSQYLDSTATDLPTLEKRFMDAAKRDYAALKRQKRGWMFEGASFDEFVYLVFTGAIKLNETADDAEGLAQLEQYLDKRKPDLSEVLYVRMQVFYYGSKRNQTPGRLGLFKEVNYLIHGPEM